MPSQEGKGNSHSSAPFEGIYKDFSIIHADAEKALSLLRGLDEKLKNAIAVNPPEPGDGDRFYQFYGLRMNCLNLISALLKQFDSGFGQDILIEAEVAILMEEEKEEEANHQKEKAIAEEVGYPIPPEWIENAKSDEAEEGEEAIAEEGGYPIPTEWIENAKSAKAADIAYAMAESVEAEEDEEDGAIGEETTEEIYKIVEQMADQVIVDLAKALGVEHEISKVTREGFYDSLVQLVKIAKSNQLKQKYKDIAFNRGFEKIYSLVLPLMKMSFEAEFQDEDGNISQDKDTLIESAVEILEMAIKQIREASIPF
ncbi:hypothetical protein NG799_02350 [Laspinema sp. D1]|uniref:Uncharacterized protein n=1 Tax=Laspinema palackyanum D2a TaxID=2953684 RepID=A0ABT2MKB1_9CYAN|nr:hypothetical protein [Laspinema sp. D2a]